MAERQTTVLITGFGPFPGTPENASSDYAKDLGRAARHAFPDLNIIAKTLPTEWTTAPEQLRKVICDNAPGLMLLFGVSDRATGFEIETQAVNACAMENDARGVLPASNKICENGPCTRLATLPFKSIIAHLDALQIPATLSDDAGHYLCNAALYEALTHCTTTRRAGFIHLPKDIRAGDSNLDWDLAVTGGVEMIRVCLNIDPDR